MKQSLGYRQFKFSQRIPNKKIRQLNIENIRNYKIEKEYIIFGEKQCSRERN